MDIGIDHPPSIGIVNKKVLDGFCEAYLVARKLAAQGFVVKQIRTDTDKSIVWLAPTRKCKQLASFTHKHVHDQTGRYQIRVAVMDGCEVHWKAIGAAA